MSDASFISEDEFRRLGEFLYRRTGMVFPEAKRYFVERRVAARMQATGSTSFASYFARLRTNLHGEIEQIVNAFTVNETYFYREEHQFRCLTADLLPQRLAAKPRGQAVRIWSIACATGEEPYSIAMWLLENWPEVDTHDIEIVGSDIDTRVLDAARAGIYGNRALMRLPQSVIDRYLEPLDGGNWRITQDLRESVDFTQVNMVEMTETRTQGRFDVIFCRNALIYFDDASRRLAAQNLYENLWPGGFICLGHSESMSRISSLFEVCRYNDAIVYRRPMEPDRD